MASEDFNGDRGYDGRMIAEGWQGYACDDCACYHIELLDNDNNVFAVMAVSDEMLIDLAHALLTFAARLAKEEVHGRPN